MAIYSGLHLDFLKWSSPKYIEQEKGQELLTQILLAEYE